jgi:hypothetical protein
VGELEENLIQWIQRISEKKDELGGFSICPFAKKVLEEKQIHWSCIAYECKAYILRYIESLENFEIVIFYNLLKNLTDGDLIETISELQKKRPDLIFLKDHPSNPGFINGVNTGNGEYPIILVQPREKLIQAREKLQNTKYYDYWSEEYKKEIFGYGN